MGFTPSTVDAFITARRVEDREPSPIDDYDLVYAQYLNLRTQPLTASTKNCPITISFGQLRIFRISSYIQRTNTQRAINRINSLWSLISRFMWIYIYKYVWIFCLCHTIQRSLDGVFIYIYMCIK